MDGDNVAALAAGEAFNLISHSIIDKKTDRGDVLRRWGESEKLIRALGEH